MKTFVLLFLSAAALSAQIKPLVSTYLGDGERNFYGNVSPTKLKVKWKTHLGSGKTEFGNGDVRTWKGAGWTGQPLVIEENGEIYLIQGTLSHHLKKIRARDGKVVWSTSVGDVIKGTPTFADVKRGDAENRYVLITGSRSGFGQHWRTGTAHSLHGISYVTGKKLWRHNSRATASNSRDCDASALMIGSKACVPLENGYFTVFSPDPAKAKMVEGFPAPSISKQYLLYRESDRQLYRSELCCESSPTLYGGKAYVAAGVGRLYSCGTGMFGGAGWGLDIGGDLNGTMPLTNDKHLLVGIERQFIPGKGGVMKVKPGGGVKWFYPAPNVKFYTWNGGLVGSPAVNHRYESPVSKDLACFVDVNATLTLINHKEVQPGVMVPGPLMKKQFPVPVVLDQVKLPTGSISTPLFVGNKIIVGYDNGMDLYEVTAGQKLRRLDRLKGPMFDATPVVWNGRVYAGSKNGYLYCLGN
ncbi:MAG: PQQ-binding-like beta-propeller repeat protein [Verrucomicrobiaceae bacterium]